MSRWEMASHVIPPSDDFVPSHWHEEECKSFIQSRIEPWLAPCICPEVKAAFERGRESHDAAPHIIINVSGTLTDEQMRMVQVAARGGHDRTENGTDVTPAVIDHTPDPDIAYHYPDCSCGCRKKGRRK